MKCIELRTEIFWILDYFGGLTIFQFISIYIHIYHLFSRFKRSKTLPFAGDLLRRSGGAGSFSCAVVLGGACISAAMDGNVTRTSILGLFFKEGTFAV